VDGRSRGHAVRLLPYRVLHGMSDKHQVVRPLFDNERLPPVSTRDLLMPRYYHEPLECLSPEQKLSIIRKQAKHRGESRCPQKHDLIVRILSEGCSRGKIADEVGASFRAVNQYIARHGLAEQVKPYMETAREKRAEIQDLWKQGITQREIANRLGINRWSVCEILSGRVKRNR